MFKPYFFPSNLFLKKRPQWHRVTLQISYIAVDQRPVIMHGHLIHNNGPTECWKGSSPKPIKLLLSSTICIIVIPSSTLPQNKAMECSSPAQYEKQICNSNYFYFHVGLCSRQHLIITNPLSNIFRSLVSLYKHKRRVK